MSQPATTETPTFVRGMGLYDATMIVMGAMIGSGIFIVSADMARLINSPGWLLAAWVLTGVLTIAAALCFGELAAMYAARRRRVRVSARSVLPAVGISVRLDAVHGDPDGHHRRGRRGVRALLLAARAAGIGKPLSDRSRAYFAGLCGVAFHRAAYGDAVIVLLTWTNSRGLHYGKIVQNIFTSAKVAALAALVLAGLLLGWNARAVHGEFHPSVRAGRFRSRWACRPAASSD